MPFFILSPLPTPVVDVDLNSWRSHLPPRNVSEEGRREGKGALEMQLDCLHLISNYLPRAALEKNTHPLMRKGSERQICQVEGRVGRWWKGEGGDNSQAIGGLLLVRLGTGRQIIPSFASVSTPTFISTGGLNCVLQCPYLQNGNKAVTCLLEQL